MAFSSQQRRCHDLELELLQLKQAAEAAQARRAQIDAGDRRDRRRRIAEAQAQGDAHRRARSPTCRSALHDELAEREAARHARNEAEVAFARGRERVRVAERAAQEADFAERSCRERMAELERRRERLAAQARRSSAALLAQLTSERAAIDWTPVEAGAAAAAGRRAATPSRRSPRRATGWKRWARDLRAAEEARLAAEQKLEPARAKIEDMRFKEQAAQLAEAAVHRAARRSPRRRRVAARRAQGVGQRAHAARARSSACNAAIAELGAVNLAALDELAQAQRAQGVPRPPGRRPHRSDGHARDRDPPDRPRIARSSCSRRSTPSTRTSRKLFPALFGGGHAQLVLTGEEILDSGVQVVAQPPGKRNTSIHLLSGGEKALTAISLVFALFQLNPAPFCLLDEVDAPLDDPNTDRFCAMVRDMAAQTQFLFISHNKITMEMANQLVGITMPEPGASRVVAVDIAEALTLAENAALESALSKSRAL